MLSLTQAGSEAIVGMNRLRQFLLLDEDFTVAKEASCSPKTHQMNVLLIVSAI